MARRRRREEEQAINSGATEATEPEASDVVAPDDPAHSPTDAPGPVAPGGLDVPELVGRVSLREHPLAAGIRMFTAMLDEARGGYIVDRLEQIEEALDVEFNEAEAEGIAQVAGVALDEDGLPDVEHAVQVALRARMDLIDPTRMVDAGLLDDEPEPEVTSTEGPPGDTPDGRAADAMAEAFAEDDDDPNGDAPGPDEGDGD